MAAHPAGPYRRILVPVGDTGASELAMTFACRLAADRGATVTVLAAIEVPASLPLEAQMHEEEQAARSVLAGARAIAELHGVTVALRTVRARAAGEAIVAEAGDRESELVVLGAARRRRASRDAPVFGSTVAFVLAHAPCRVLVAAPAS